MADFTQEIKRLQKLSCISLSPKEEEKFWQQLTEIIDFLGKLPDTKTTTSSWHTTEKLSLRTIQQQDSSCDAKQLLQNVHHPVINNSIVIKSALS